MVTDALIEDQKRGREWSDQMRRDRIRESLRLDIQHTIVVGTIGGLGGLGGGMSGVCFGP